MSRFEGVVIGLSIAAGVTGLVYLYQNNVKRKGNRRTASRAELYDGFIPPPLPETIVRLLKSARLCYLATQDEGEPHLSLMRFTYYQAEEAIILTTRRNTKKFELMKASKHVAVLIHDFDEESKGKTYSITLNGWSDVLTPSSDDEVRYRALHLENNLDYPQFIVGPDIAVILIKVESARLCDVQDKVITWSAKK
jgi:general stress protein 26